MAIEFASLLVRGGDSFLYSCRRRHTRYWRDWSSDVCSSDLAEAVGRYSLGVHVGAALQVIHRRSHGHLDVVAVVHTLEGRGTLAGHVDQEGIVSPLCRGRPSPEGKLLAESFSTAYDDSRRPPLVGGFCTHEVGWECAPLVGDPDRLGGWVEELRGSTETRAHSPPGRAEPRV